MRAISHIIQFVITTLDVMRRMIFGAKRQRYTYAVTINAPVQAVWDVIDADSITIEGIAPTTITSIRRPENPEMVDSTISVFDKKFDMVTRIMEYRPREIFVSQVLKGGTHPDLYYGDEYYIAIGLDEDNGKTILTITHELTHTSLAGRLNVAYGAPHSANSIKSLVEKQVGTGDLEQPSWHDSVSAAVMTGVLTLASFAILFDWTFALLLIGVLFVHEFGHIVAMRWCGLPVKGMYFVPFLGAVAVASSPWRSEAERGFVALMGPAFSILPTAAALYFWSSGGSQFWFSVALISAFLNGLNLIPVLPLDGGHIFGSLMSRIEKDVRRLIELALLICAIALAVYVEEWVALVFAVLVFFVLVNSRKPARSLPKIEMTQFAWLFAAYAATLTFYGAMAYMMLNKI